MHTGWRERGWPSGYGSWVAMRQRCQNPAHSAYRYYGARGISVCARWESFEAFIADMGPRPPGGTVERVNNDGNYEPANCRWASRKEQSNNSRQCVAVEVNGKVMSLTQAAVELGVPYATIRTRLSRGWPVEQALRAAKHTRRINESRMDLSSAHSERKR